MIALMGISMRDAEGNMKHSYTDLGLWIQSKQIDPPTPRRIEVEVPYMNGNWDFSTAQTGSLTYGNRKLQYVFEIVENTKEELTAKRVQAEEWFYSSAQNETDLYDDAFEGHFRAKLQSIDVAEKGRQLTITVTFSAYPKRILDDGSEVI